MSILNRQVLGLDISDREVEAVLVTREGPRLTVTSYGYDTLEPGLVNGGVIVDQAGLARSIRKLLGDRMTPPLPKGADRVAVSLPDSEVFTHVFEVPRLADEKRLGAILASKADAFFPYPHEELTGVFTTIAQRPDTKDVHYAAIRTSVLEGYRRLSASLGLKPVCLEPESASVARAALELDERDPVALVDIGAAATEVSVYDRDGLHFSESIGHAGDMSAIADARGSRDELAVMLDGIAETVASYESGGRAVGKILLYGYGATMPGLLERASERLESAGGGRSVSFADPWRSVEPAERLESLRIRSRGPLIAPAVGLSLRGVQVRKFPEIDFMRPPSVEPRGKRQSRRVVPLLAAAAALAIGGAILSFSYSSRPGHREIQAPAYVQPQTLRVDAQVKIGPAFSAEGWTLSGAPHDVDISVTDRLTRAVSRSDGKASGIIYIVNTTTTAHRLIAATRFLSADGVLFRLDGAASIPAGGRIAAHATADLAGESGDVPAGRFTVPGLPVYLQTKIFGETEDAMAGGVVETWTPFTLEERVKAESDLWLAAKDQAISLATSAAGRDMLVPAGLVLVGDMDMKGMPPIGSATGTVAVSATATARYFAIRRDEAEKLLRLELASRLGGPADAYSLSGIGAKVVSFDQSSDDGVIALSADANWSGTGK